jgi:hypothetical protein
VFEIVFVDFEFAGAAATAAVHHAEPKRFADHGHRQFVVHVNDLLGFSAAKRRFSRDHVLQFVELD